MEILTIATATLNLTCNYKLLQFLDKMVNDRLFTGFLISGMINLFKNI